MVNNPNISSFHPTANCIRTAFLCSGKRHLILAGSDDTAKTALLAELYQILPQDTLLSATCPGTPEVFEVDLSAPYGNIGCVIMASGLGKRFGGNKLMADFHGTPMIARVLDATEGIFTQRVVVTRHADVAGLCQERGVHAVFHALPHRSDTVRLGLTALGQDLDSCIFCSGDQPLLQQETVAALALAGKNDRASIWRTAWEHIAGTPVLFPRKFFAELRTLPKGCGGSYVIKKHPEQVHAVPVRDMYELKDIDTQEDLSVLLGR